MGGGWGGHKAVVYRFRRGVGEWGVGGWVGGDVTRRWYIGSDEGWVGRWVGRSQGWRWYIGSDEGWVSGRWVGR